MTLFYENSTRTRTSFEAAGKYMSADVINISGSTSSATKGESLRDTFLTLQALTADLIVMRTPFSGACHQAAEWVGVPVVNAGDGMHEHPTQGLLDLLTLRQAKGSLDGLTVAIVGDIAHSRVARSNIWGLTQNGRDVSGWSAPPPSCRPMPPACRSKSTPTFAPGWTAWMWSTSCACNWSASRRALFPTAREYSRLFGVTPRRPQRRQARRPRSAPRPDESRPGNRRRCRRPAPQSLVEKQVTNGVAVRMAVLYLLLGAEG